MFQGNPPEVVFASASRRYSKMKFSSLCLFGAVAAAAPNLGKREQFSKGQPIDDKGKGAPILGMTPTKAGFALYD